MDEDGSKKLLSNFEGKNGNLCPPPKKKKNPSSSSSSEYNHPWGQQRDTLFSATLLCIAIVEDIMANSPSHLKMHHISH